jgi:hypothetical protein
MKRWVLRLWCKLTGRVLISDYVNVTITLSKPVQQPTFNPELILGKAPRA